MRAAVISEYQVPPALVERDEPQTAAGKAVLELRAAGLNPADLAVASGSFPFGSPPLPYVPGIEGVGTVVHSGRFAPGTRGGAPRRGRPAGGGGGAAPWGPGAPPRRGPGCGPRGVGSESAPTGRSRSG